MKKRIKNILFYSFIILLLIFTFLKSQDYNNYLSINTITNKKTLKQYNKNSLVKIKTDNIIETRFKITYQNKNYKICYVTFDDTSLLLELTDEDLNKKEVIGSLKNGAGNILELQNKIIDEEKLSNFSNKYFTVKNNKTINKIIYIKLILIIFVFTISILSIIYNLIKLILHK